MAWCILFLGMPDGLEDKACLLTTDTGDAGSSPHVARGFFQWCSMTNIAIYIIKKSNLYFSHSLYESVYSFGSPNEVIPAKFPS